MTIGKPGYKRSVRLRELFLQEVSKGLRDIKDPGLAGLLTITDLKLARDLKSARVYYSLLGSAQDHDSTQKALDRAAGFLRRRLLTKLSLRFIPKLSFHLDETPKEAQRIENLLNKIRAEDGSESRPAAPPSEKLDVLAAGPKQRRRRRSS